ncbi:MAG TPA: enoyl-CoA hydratase-related protein [Nocardioidaceae bacterium]|nr:enoyl-CoA hydratase-related protein [Nocardioidaceae bacterium]
MTTVLTEDHGGVRVLTLNRPDVRNAIDIELRVELGDALEKAMAEPSVRVIVLTGAGPLFCSGGDISTMRRMDADEAAHRTELAQRVIRAITQGPKPVLAAVEGGAFGAGLSLAIACDRVVAADDARFSVSFQRVGLAGDMGIFGSLPARIGPSRAKQLLLFPTEVPAAEALTMGLVDALVQPGAALEAALADAARLAAGPARAFAATKKLLRISTDILAAEAAEQVELFGSADFGEGVAAFHERRKPVFTEPI